MIGSTVDVAIALALIALIIAAALSPLETLSWWAGWTDAEIEPDGDAEPEVDTPAIAAKKAYVVYLSGIATLSGDYLLRREKIFLRGLREKAIDAVIIDNVFPYSPSGSALIAGPRIFDRFWRGLQKIRLEGRRAFLGVLINLRNVFQVMVSADHRYGPIFNQGAAVTIERALRSAGHRRGDGALVLIIGYSGGAQIAVGAAPFLSARLRAPVDVVAIGGVMASDPGLRFLRKLHLIVGGRDRVRRLGQILFPERWPIFPGSAWNAGLREGRIETTRFDDVTHAGPRGYFGLPRHDGVSRNERMQETIVDILKSALAGADDNASRRAR